MNFRLGGFQTLTPVVKNLLIINALFFLATYSLGKTFNINLYDSLGLRYFGADNFMPYQFITYMFMHGGFMHIFFNMFALYMFGNVLEQVWGPKRFLFYYFFTGIGAAVLHYAVFYFQMQPTLSAINDFLAQPTNEGLHIFLKSEHFQMVSHKLYGAYQVFTESYNAQILAYPDIALENGIEFISFYKKEFINAPNVVGASGAVFGILLAFGMLFPNTMLYVYFAIPIKAKYFVMIYGAIELYLGISNSGGSNIAHFAHLGGMLFGFILIKLWNKSTKNFF